MTNDEIKKQLLSLESTDADFTVIMTGKTSKKMNGFYKRDTHEILLFNRKFKNDNELMYTAIHEYTHHLINVENEKQGIIVNGRSHDTTFWAKMDDLLDSAVREGIYTRTRSEKLSSLIDEAIKIDRHIAALKMELGMLLIKINAQAKEEGVRFEDILSHDMKIEIKTSRTATAAAQIPITDIGQDEQEILIKQYTKNKEKFAISKKALEEGKTLAQTKKELASIDEYEQSKLGKLIRERERILKTVSTLKIRIQLITDRIEELTKDYSQATG